MLKIWNPVLDVMKSFFSLFYSVETGWTIYGIVFLIGLVVALLGVIFGLIFHFRGDDDDDDD